MVTSIHVFRLKARTIMWALSQSSLYMSLSFHTCHSIIFQKSDLKISDSNSDSSSFISKNDDIRFVPVVLIRVSIRTRLYGHTLAILSDVWHVFFIWDLIICEIWDVTWLFHLEYDMIHSYAIRLDSVLLPVTWLIHTTTLGSKWTHSMWDSSRTPCGVLAYVKWITHKRYDVIWRDPFISDMTCEMNQRYDVWNESLISDMTW